MESGGTDHRLYVHVNRPHVWFGPEVYAVNFTHRVYKPRGRVFPGSAQNWPLSQPDIDQYAAQLFSKWGGIDKAKECFPDLNWN